MTLPQIAKRTKPKKDYLRTFLPRYEQLFEPLRNDFLTLLEIGVGGYKWPNKGGGSLRMWAEYFPNSRIAAMDHYEKKLELPPNAAFHRGSQTDAELLSKLADDYQGFDIVIDDASHVTANTIITFEALRRHTRLFYTVEDLHMSKAKGTREYFQQVKGADFLTQNLCVVTL